MTSTRIRKIRGWKWEDTLVKRLNKSYSWIAYRLGSSSPELPDILAISNKFGCMLVIEAKSGTTEQLIVRREQIERCMRFSNSFRLYPKRYVVLAFKFMSKKRVGKGKYERRERREYFKLFDKKLKKGERAPDVICTYSGKTYALSKGRRVELDIPDFKMPFQK
ncbi:MAG: resolvase [Thaumarchaeota archaeon]|nr:resolvase [Nitrososphaerota archaeon]